MNTSRALRTWMLITGIGALIAFVLFSLMRSFMPSGDFGTFYIAPAPYSGLVTLALLTVGLGIAWIVLMVVWLVKRGTTKSR